MALKVTSQNFNEEVIKSSEPVLVDFFADWCGPCQMLAPILEDISDSDLGVKVGKVNVDEEPELAANFGVQSIPLLILFKDGKVVNQAIGYRGKEEILKMIGDN